MLHSLYIRETVTEISVSWPLNFPVCWSLTEVFNLSFSLYSRGTQSTSLLVTVANHRRNLEVGGLVLSLRPEYLDGKRFAVSTDKTTASIRREAAWGSMVGVKDGQGRTLTAGVNRALAKNA